MKKHSFFIGAGWGVGALLCIVPWAHGDTELVSKGRLNTTADDSSHAISITPDGGYAVFESFASDLVAGDTNGRRHIFVYDRSVETITRVSVDSSGVEGNSDSTGASISDDGRYVAFLSGASNLVAGDTNSWRDVFVHDRYSGITERVNVDSAGTQANSANYNSTISSTGAYVVFLSSASNLVPGDTNNAADVFVHHRSTGTTQRVSVDSAGVQGDAHSGAPSISDDGMYIAFRSTASNLVAGDTNGVDDIFVHNRNTGITERVSVSSSGVQGDSSGLLATISGDGRYVAYLSGASNLVIGDTNNKDDVFVHNRSLGTTELISVDSTGAQSNDNSEHRLSISADGTSVVFSSRATNLVANDTNDALDVFVRNRNTDQTTRVSVTNSELQGNDHSFTHTGVSTISDDGRYVGFASNANNLVEDDWNSQTDVFIRDRTDASTKAISLSSSPLAWATGQSELRSLSRKIGGPGGRYLVFSSYASNLVLGDTNNTSDVFVYDRHSALTERVSVDSVGMEGNSGSDNASISVDGRYIVFHSYADNLAADDTNARRDVFLHDRNTGMTTRVSVGEAGIEGNGSSQEPSISANFIAFQSSANNLVSDDSNDQNDIFIHNFLTGTTRRASVDSSGAEADGHSSYPILFNNGNEVAFTSRASNLVAGDTNNADDIFIHNPNTGTTSLVSVSSAGLQGNGRSSLPNISADGRFLVFHSDASNLVAGDTNDSGDVFLHNRDTGVTERVSIDSFEAQSNNLSVHPSVSSDGSRIAFISAASNLVAGDTNGWLDIFVRNRITGDTKRISVSTYGEQSNSHSLYPSISDDGASVLFMSMATNLDPFKTTPRRTPQVYLATLTTDSDSDGVDDGEDNCRTVFNPGQEQTGNNVGGPFGDACVDPSVSIPPNADVDPTATVDADTHINKNVTVGADSSVGSNVVLNKGVSVGDGVDVGDGAILNKNVEIGDGASVGAGVTISKGVYIGPRAVIGDGAFIGRDSVVCDGAIIGNNATLNRNVFVGIEGTVPAGDNVPKNTVIAGEGACAVP